VAPDGASIPRARGPRRSGQRRGGLRFQRGQVQRRVQRRRGRPVQLPAPVPRHRRHPADACLRRIHRDWRVRERKEDRLLQLSVFAISDPNDQLRRAERQCVARRRHRPAPRRRAGDGFPQDRGEPHSGPPRLQFRSAGRGQSVRRERGVPRPQRLHVRSVRRSVSAERTVERFHVFARPFHQLAVRIARDLELSARRQRSRGDDARARLPIGQERANAPFHGRLRQSRSATRRRRTRRDAPRQTVRSLPGVGAHRSGRRRGSRRRGAGRAQRWPRERHQRPEVRLVRTIHRRVHRWWLHPDRRRSARHDAADPADAPAEDLLPPFGRHWPVWASGRRARSRVRRPSSQSIRRR
jgi:hypothetical protein